MLDKLPLPAESIDNHPRSLRRNEPPTVRVISHASACKCNTFLRTILISIGGNTIMKPRSSIAAVFLSAIIATTAVPAHAANDPDSTQTLKDMTTPRSTSNNGNTMQPTLKKGEPTFSTTALTDARIGTPTPWGNVNIYHTTVVQSANVYGDGAWYAWQD
ncbi:hypothetical protein AB4Y81_09920 [Paenarthrobacter sp. TAF1]|uniref:hypothetical protein n=1 Tax=Paenarthrobacter sp. TAF1 TaxID=3233067 RepID=UPI003F99644C